jgi:hypothetical protein
MPCTPNARGRTNLADRVNNLSRAINFQRERAVKIQVRMAGNSRPTAAETTRARPADHG